MVIRNLTPHDVRILGEDNVLVIYPDGVVARLASHDVKSSWLPGPENVHIPVYRTVYGDVEGLPSEEDGVVFIVSAMVRAARPDRRDLYSPAKLVRDDDGNVVGCLGLTSQR
jgi:hypothetical protein